MAQLRITKYSKKYGFKKGETYEINRKNNTDYTIIMPDNRPNVVFNDRTLKRYGIIENEKG